jgi:hypothetical protein
MNLCETVTPMLDPRYPTEIEQSAGSHSTLITNASGSVNFNAGMSYTDVKAAVEDLMTANMVKFREEALETARQEAARMAEVLFERFQSDPSRLERFDRPAVQSALVHAVQGAVLSGDSEQMKLLAEMLYERAGEPVRELAAVVLERAIEVTRQLTSAEVALLAITWVGQYIAIRPADLDRLREFYRQLLPFVARTRHRSSSLNYVTSMGCGHTGIFERPPGFILTNYYPGIFSNGIAAENLPGEMRGLSSDVELFQFATADRTRLFINATSEDDLRLILERKDLVDYNAQLVELWKKSSVGQQEAVEMLCGDDVELQQVMSALDDVKALRLTTTGLVVAHAEMDRVAPGEYPSLTDTLAM